MSFSLFHRSEARRGHEPNRSRKPSRRAAKRWLGFESLESRQLLSVSPTTTPPPPPPTPITTLNFNIPAEVANLGVQVGVYSSGDSQDLPYYLDASSGTFKSVSGLFPGDAISLFNLTPAQSTYTSPVSYSLAIPTANGANLVGGEIIIFVGPVNTGLVVNASSQIATPKAAVDPAVGQPGDLFSQIEFTYYVADPAQHTVANLDLDTSAVDSTGFPLTLVYPNDVDVSYPLTSLGITLDLADLNNNFVTAFSDGGAYSNYTNYADFLQCATYAQMTSQPNLQVIAPQDILAAEDAPQTNSVVTAADSSSTLALNCNYYYRITAFSDNVIDGSDGVLGETKMSNRQNVTAQAMQSPSSNTLTWNAYCDPNTVGYNIYRYSSTDPTAPTHASAYNLVATVYGINNTTYVDSGAIPQAKQISVDADNGYGFNPLSEYYTEELQTFFDYYKTNTFYLYRDSIFWEGQTTTYTPTASWNTANESYTVLQLTATNSATTKHGTINVGDKVNVYEPIFSTNTLYVDPDAPAAPSWLLSASETPAEMVFGCDAVFASNTLDPDVKDNAALAGVLADIENSIGAALNRGVATMFPETPTTGLCPNNWAAFPQISNAPVVASDATSQLSAGTYYYYVTAVSDSPTLETEGETTPSLEVTATVAAQQSATLDWTASVNAVPGVTYTYNIYRGTSPNELYLLDSTAELTYTDNGSKTPSTAPPYEYFTNEHTSNLYAAFVQTNSAIDPVNGVSLNGLSYGFAYSDQGGLSTNITFFDPDIPTNVTVNLGNSSELEFVTQNLPNAVVGTPYSQSFVVCGDGVGTVYQVKSGVLPTGFTLNPDTGVLGGTALSSQVGSYAFTVEAENSNGKIEMPFTLAIDLTPPTETHAVKPTSTNHGSSSNTSHVVAPVSSTTTEPETPDVGASTQDVIISTTTPTPAVDSSQNVLYTNSHTLLVFGAGFQPTLGAPVSVTLTSTSGTPTITTTTVVSDNQITLTGVDLSNCGGLLYATVTVDGVPSKTTCIATLNNPFPSPTTPTLVIPSPIPNFYSNGTTLVINGFGFTPDPATGPTVTLNAYYGAAGWLQLTGSTATCDTANQVTVHDIALVDTAPQIAITNPGTKYTSPPTVSFSEGDATATATVANGMVTGITITSLGSGVTSNTLITLTGGTTGTQAAATIVSLQSLQFINATVYDSINGNSANTKVVNITEGTTGNAPTVQQPTTIPDISGNTSTITITGTNFDATNNNYVTLYTDDGNTALPVGTIASLTGYSGIQNIVATATQLTVTLAGPLPLGDLYASVITDGVSSGAPVQIANVTTLAPIVYSTTTTFSPNPTLLTISGSGFDSSGINTVTLSHGEDKTVIPDDAIVSVMADSGEQLTVILNADFELPNDTIWASVTAHGYSSGTSGPIATIADAGPTITYSAQNLANTATTLVIQGTDFSVDSEVALTTCTGSTLDCTIASATATQLTLTLNATQLAKITGQLYATVTTSGDTSATVEVANIIAALAPTVTPGTGRLANNVSQIVINGANFDTSGASDNSVTLSSGTVASVVVNSSTMLTVNVTGPLTNGALSASVTTNGLTSQLTPIATVVAPVTPSITAAENNNILTTATTLSIYGTGFDTNSGATYAVTLSSGTAASVQAVSATELQVTLNTYFPLNTGALTATVIVDGISTNTVQVATAVPTPTITTSTTNWTIGTSTLTIRGAHFNPIAANNTVLLSNGADCTIVSANSLCIVVQVTQAPTVGPLSAKVISADLASTDWTVVATAVPGVTASTASVFRTAKTFTISGAGFDTIASHNKVTLSSGTVKILSATSTKLVCQFVTTPHYGPLNAKVTVDGVASSLTRVATITGPAATTTSTLTASVKTITVGGATKITMQAKDARGYIITTGGLKVTFALVSGSAGGKFGPVTDNHNGTYSVWFTASKKGSDTITASFAGTKLTAKVTVTVKAKTSDPKVAASLAPHGNFVSSDGDTGSTSLNKRTAALYRLLPWLNNS